MTTLSYRLVESIGDDALVAPAHLLRSLDRVLFHEPEDLVASVEAGITLEELQSQLAGKGQFLPLEAPLPSRGTIGGILAADTSGPSRLAYGTARDWLIGIKVVHSDGVVTKSGGRVVKNVTGYDLNKLYVGSLGTLGVIVEATFKVAPLPSDGRTLIATYPSLSAAMDSALELLLQSYTPQALQVVNREVIKSLPELRVPGGAEAAVLALFAGRKAAVKRLADEWAKVFGDGGAITVESLSWTDGDALWRALLDLEWVEEERPQLALKVTILPSRLREFLEMVASPRGSSFKGGLVADMAGVGVERLISSLRERAGPYWGHVVVERCPLDVKANLDVWGDPVEGMGIMRRLKQEFDPAAILNPGRFAGGI